MLQELSIKNLAIIDELDVEFGNQMTVLTGETGAGKSIIIDAVSLLAGGRSSQELIRKGSDSLSVQGSFLIDNNDKTGEVLASLGVEVDEDQTIVIERQVHRNGRNVIRVNGQMMNATMLRKIGTTLVDIQGQNDHQELLQPERHLEMLDAFGDQKLAALKKDYQQKYAKYKHLADKIANQQKNQKEFAQHVDMLKFQVQEIDEAYLMPDEEDQLETERERLSNFQKINDALSQSTILLSGNDEGISAVDQVGAAMEQMQSIGSYDPDFAKVADQLANAFYELQDVTNDISGLADDLQWDEGRLNEIENRLELIKNLEHKYGDSIPAILDYYQKVKVELAEAISDDVPIEELQSQLDNCHGNALATGQKLSEVRHQVAQKLEEDVNQQLADLYMADAVFQVNFASNPEENLNSNGLDQVEFYIQTNRGEGLGPLAKIASGGEVSRMMLALKAVFSKNQGVSTIIFDEVDTGVSGRVAQAIAEKIKAIAHTVQVLCITHLPQVAAVANDQFFIEKQVVDNRTITTVHKLTDDKRVGEIARMTAGTEVTELALEHAQELLRMGQNE